MTNKLIWRLIVMITYCYTLYTAGGGPKPGGSQQQGIPRHAISTLHWIGDQGAENSRFSKDYGTFGTWCGRQHKGRIPWEANCLPLVSWSMTVPMLLRLHRHVELPWSLLSVVFASSPFEAWVEDLPRWSRPRFGRGDESHSGLTYGVGSRPELEWG